MNKRQKKKFEKKLRCKTYGRYRFRYLLKFRPLRLYCSGCYIDIPERLLVETPRDVRCRLIRCRISHNRYMLSINRINKYLKLYFGKSSIIGRGLSPSMAADLTFFSYETLPIDTHFTSLPRICDFDGDAIIHTPTGVINLQ